MSTPIRAEGDTFADALTAAVADLVGCEPVKVDLSLQAPGLDDVAGRVRLDLEIGASAAATPVAEPDDDRTDAATTAEPDQAEPRRERGDRDGRSDADHNEVVVTAEELDAEADAAADFLEGLLDALDLPGDLKIRVLDDHAEVEVTDIGGGALIGRRGQTLDAIQELLRCALQRQFEHRCHVQVDVEGYRARRLDKLVDKAQEAIDEVLDTGESQRLEPMDVFERKAVHQLVAQHEGLSSRSQGREPGRRIIIETV